MNSLRHVGVQENLYVHDGCCCSASACCRLTRFLLARPLARSYDMLPAPLSVTTPLPRLIRLINTVTLAAQWLHCWTIDLWLDKHHACTDVVFLTLYYCNLLTAKCIVLY